MLSIQDTASHAVDSNSLHDNIIRVSRNYFVPSCEEACITLVLNLSGEVIDKKDANNLCTADLESFRNYKALLNEICQVTILSETDSSTMLVGLDELIAIPRAKKEGLAPLSESFHKTLRALPPYFNLLQNSHLALTNQDSLSSRAQKEIVHKRQEENVLISRPYRMGSLYWFNMFEESGEFRFDHASDHVQGMLLMEGLRQASIASVHLAGLVTEGSIALLSFDITFSSYTLRGHKLRFSERVDYVTV